jgi:hypothetical protein
MPSVTEPPADERPPMTRPTIIIVKLLLRAQMMTDKFTHRSDACMIEKRPNSSDHGAQSSHPKAYETKKATMPSQRY